MKKTRRNFLLQAGQFTAGIGLLGFYSCDTVKETIDTGVTKTKDMMEDMTIKQFFKISLAQWSLNKAFFGGELDNLDFSAKTKNDFGIDAVEYSSQFFQDKANDFAFLKQMKQRADDNGVKSLLIMIDNEGNLGALDEAERAKAVENHYKWVDAAKFLDCHSIRVNAFGVGTAKEVGTAAVDGLGKLSEYAAKDSLNIIVENHGSYSSNGAWLADVMKNVGMDNCGTLPDFGNFCIKRDNGRRWGGNCIEEYDRYKGVIEMMPYAKAISAKSHDFDSEGNETHTDYVKMLQIVKDAGYRGYIGIEYEGEVLDADAGIKATRELLRMAGAMVS
jgi:sugar phosphate isomerase/epimerase